MCFSRLAGAPSVIVPKLRRASKDCWACTIHQYFRKSGRQRTWLPEKKVWRGADKLETAGRRVPMKQGEWNEY
jgi:hypothetical protein